MRQVYLLILFIFPSILALSSPVKVEIGGSDSLVVSIPPKPQSKKLSFKSAPATSFNELEKSLGAEYASKSLVREFDVLSSSNLATVNPSTSDILDPYIYEASLSDSANSQRSYAFSLLEFVEEKQRFTEQLDSKTILDLPIGIKKTIGNLEYTILIDSMVMLPTHSYLRAYMAFETPEGKKLAFRGDNIRFSRKGGLTGDARLELIGDHAMKMGSKTLLVLKGNGQTYVEWDCFGFKNMGLDAEIEFSKDLLEPDTKNGTAGDGRVKAYFTTSLSSWDDLIAEVSMDDFQVKGLEGVGFSVKSAVFDYSTLRGAPGVVFPNNYQNAAYDPAEPGFWQGFYLAELSVRLPKQFKKQGSEERIGFAAYDVIIDDMGFTGTLQAQNVLGNGEMDKWPFTVETLQVTLIANQIEGAGFEGLVTVPVDKENPFEYTAIINPGDEYIFAVSPSENLKFDFLKTTEVTIDQSSFIEVIVKDQKFLPKAILNGQMSIGAEEANLTSLKFERLELQTVEPFVRIGGFSLGMEGKEQKLGAFTIGINEIGIASTANPNEIGLKVGATVKIVGEDDGAFGATGGVTILGEVHNGGREWQYNGLVISKLGVEFNTGAVAIKGHLEWFKKDFTYGDGIRGKVRVDVIDKITVDAVALFGNKDDFRFWFFDALATIPGGAGTGVVVKSFGGGAFNHMRQSLDGSGSLLGESLSGIVYVPDKSTALGLRATVDLATAGSEKMFNGSATFEITFNSGGGIRMIDFKGEGYFLSDPLQVDIAGLKEKAGGLVAGAANTAMNSFSPDAQVAAFIHINYDVPNKTLHGNFEVFVNVVGGVMKGIGAEGRAGWVVFHVEPGEWYIHAGSPEDPLGLEMLFGMLKTKSYFMVGDYIPGSPPPPDKVGEILGEVDLDYMAEMNALGQGRGMAFGSRVEFDTGNITFMMFYARFAAGLGFDIMLKDYGNTSCVGSSGPLGINGWYANGQAYGYFDGAIGIKVKLFGKRKKVEILSLAAAAVMQAKLPNPFWMRGIVGGEFSVLGGLVKGNCKFEVTIGEECKIQGGSILEGIEVIADVSPEADSKDVSVFTASQGVFNMEINKNFEMVDVDDVKKTFRIKLDEFKVLDGSYEIPASLEWNYYNDVVASNPVEILPPNKNLRAVVQVSFEERINGVWQPVKVDGETLTERKEVSFITGEAPDHIPMENVEYSYPVANQYNYYQNESNKGYIKLKVGQGYLFEAGDEWLQKGRFRSANGEIKYYDIAYSSQQINFDLPTGLTNNRIYAFELVNLPANDQAAIDVNVDSETTSVSGGEGQSLELETKKAEGSIDILQEKAIFETFFKTSKYNTFQSKIAAMSVSNGWSWPIMTGIHELGVNISGDEMFDKNEIIHRNGTGNLIEFEATLENNIWYESYVRPLIYPSYPTAGLTIDWRDAELWGVPPAKAIFISQNVDPVEVTPEQVEANTTVNIAGYGAFVYDLPYAMYRDYENLRQKAAEYLLERSNGWMEKLIVTPFPGVLTNDDYKMILRYKLPGTGKITTSKVINIHVD